MERPYAEGPVWSLEFIQTKAHDPDEYLENLKREWAPLMDAAREENLILDYRILLSPQPSRDEWNVAQLVQVENMAALDNYRERIDRIAAKVKGAAAGGGSCNPIRDVVAWRLAREITLK